MNRFGTIMRGRGMHRAFTFILFMLLLLPACSVRYGPRVPGFQPGYEEERLGERTYQIRVGEAWPKDRPVIGKIALYRAAELALANGFEYFAILSSSDSETNYSIYVPGSSTSTTTGSFVGNRLFATTTTTSTPGTAVPVQGNWTHLDVRFLEKSEIEGQARVVEARRVIEDLKYFIERRR